MIDEIENIVAEFRNAAIEKGDFAYGKRDSELYELMRRSFLQLKEFGESGNAKLENLLDDESVYVRSWVAAALILDNNPRAKSVLEKIAADDGILSFSARVTLDEFEKGNLGTPFPNGK